MMEVGPSRNEYVTRLSDYQELQPLLDYLLPVLATDDGHGSVSSGNEPVALPALAAIAPALHRRRADGPDSV